MQADLASVKELRGLIRHVRPDLVHLHSSKAGFIGRIAAKSERVPAIFTAHGWAFSEGTPWKQKLLAIPLEAFASRLGGHIIAVSQYDYRLALRYRIESPHRMSVVHNGIPDSPERANPGEDTIPKIVMVARFAPQKDHALLLRALASLGDEPWELEFVGNGPLFKNIKRVADELNLQNRVRFLGARYDVSRILAESHIFVLTSNYEGFPISVLEAMRAGLPVVASDVGGTNEAVDEGRTGYLVPRGDLETLRERLRLLIKDPALRREMGNAGREKYERHFTVDRMLAETSKVYDLVLGSKAGAQSPSR